MSEHWNAYYKNKTEVDDCSPFAAHINWMLPAKSHIIDVGCGNGRDSYYFAKEGHNVEGFDLNTVPAAAEKCNFYRASMGNMPEKWNIDAVYSRFSIHSVPLDVELQFLEWAHKSLRPGGKLCIEARSIKDDLYGTGKKVGEHEYIGGTSYAGAHYRRFIVLSDLEKRIKQEGFLIDHANESDEYAPYKDQRPCCVRVIAYKDNE